MANGIADNLLVTTYLSAKCPVFVAPAMDLDMYKHPANQKNIETLKSYGNIFIEPADGELASGLVGKGRLEEPEIIVKKIKAFFQKKKSLNKKNILITAGPTYEKIDAVRFIGNYSSGKMGYALAEECAERGGNVILISGPTNIETKNPAITLLKVTSAKEMYEQCIKHFKKSDAAILCAAVADFTLENTITGKLKREGNNLSLNLIPTTDIAAELGKLKEKKQIIIGFALEKENEQENAKEKLRRKNLDFIVLNSLNDKGAGFNSDTNKISIINNKGEISKFNLKSKREVATDIIDKLEEYL
jgi:phosphopantothenoylcysteine decarboxylase/phosphopantothenate--cysteine ligase